VTCYRDTSATYPAFISSAGGLVRDFREVPQLTDMQAEVTVTGPTDRVIIASQADIIFSWFGASSPFRIDCLVQVLRYKKQNAVSNVAYVLDKAVIQRNYAFTNAGSATTDVVSLAPSFSSFIDGPNVDIGTYLYVLAITAVTAPSLSLYGSQGFYNTGDGSILDNGFNATGTINQSVSSPTTFAGISPTVTSYDPSTPSTSTATLSITLTPNPNITSYSVGTNTQVVITAQSNDFHINDVLTIPGTSLGGASPANDLSLTVNQVVYPGGAFPANILVELRSITAQVVKQ
jgi:hypothetical protein